METLKLKTESDDKRPLASDRWPFWTERARVLGRSFALRVAVQRKRARVFMVLGATTIKEMAMTEARCKYGVRL